MSGIVIRGVSKVYGDSAKAVDGLDLEVQPGELVVVVGPSGSGKTTLLRLVAGLEGPTAGTICLGGQDLAGVPPERRNVALVFQSLALYGHLTVEQNLAFALNARTKGGWLRSLWRRGPVSSEARDRIAETARLLRIEHLLHRRPAELSGGEQQRVALGRAIVRQPRALLLDEPLSSLDLPTRRSLRRELKELQRKLGVPTIYVTHDQAEALAMGDRIAVLDRGRLAQVGTPMEIYERPRTRFVAEFFGPQGMNLIEGTFVEGGFEIREPDGTYCTTFGLQKESWPDALIDGPVLLGIRPEHIDIDTRGRGDGLIGTVTSIENVGESTYLHVQLFQTTTTVTVRLRSNRIDKLPKPGATAEILLDPNCIHWFDANTGDRM
jgi:ABC-type sugar transport system ATPase subunit